MNKKTLIKRAGTTLLTTILIAQFFVVGGSVSAADTSPNVPPAKEKTTQTQPADPKKTESKTAEPKKTESKPAEPKKTEVKSTATKIEAELAALNSAKNLGLDFSHNMPEAKVLKKVKTDYKKNLDKNGYYFFLGVGGHYESDFGGEFFQAPTPGAKHQIHKGSTLLLTINGKKNPNITHSYLTEYLYHKELGVTMWTLISKDPIREVPLGYALLKGHLKLEDLPKEARAWHDVGAGDSVNYWPAFGTFSYNSYLTLEQAINLSNITQSQVPTAEWNAYKAGKDVIYNPHTQRVFISPF